MAVLVMVSQTRPDTFYWDCKRCGASCGIFETRDRADADAHAHVELDHPKAVNAKVAFQVFP